LIPDSFPINNSLCVISVFYCEAARDCVLLGYYAASSSNSLPTFWNNLSVPSPRALKPIGCPETSARNYHYWPPNNPEERSSQQFIFRILTVFLCASKYDPVMYTPFWNSAAYQHIFKIFKKILEFSSCIYFIIVCILYNLSRLPLLLLSTKLCIIVLYRLRSQCYLQL
jgi:hypothetical protein